MATQNDAPRELQSQRLGFLGALVGSALPRNRWFAIPVIRDLGPKSAGVLRDQQTLDETTGTHGHLLRFGWRQPAADTAPNPEVQRPVTADRTRKD